MPGRKATQEPKQERAFSPSALARPPSIGRRFIADPRDPYSVKKAALLGRANFEVRSSSGAGRELRERLNWSACEQRRQIGRVCIDLEERQSRFSTLKRGDQFLEERARASPARPRSATAGAAPRWRHGGRSSRRSSACPARSARSVCRGGRWGRGGARRTPRAPADRAGRSCRPRKSSLGRARAAERCRHGR